MTLADCEAAWLPPHVPTDVMNNPAWEFHLLDVGRGFVLVSGTQAYAFICDHDYRAVEIKAYIDGECTHHWRRDPIDGTCPGTYEWQAVAVYGKGLVP